MFQAVESDGAARSSPFSAIAPEQGCKCLIVWFQNHAYLDDIEQCFSLFHKGSLLGNGLVSGAQIQHCFKLAYLDHEAVWTILP